MKRTPLEHDDRTGVGQMIDCCLLDSARWRRAASAPMVVGKLMQVVNGNATGGDAGPMNSAAGAGDARRRAVETW